MEDFKGVSPQDYEARRKFIEEKLAEFPKNCPLETLGKRLLIIRKGNCHNCLKRKDCSGQNQDKKE